MSLLENIQSLCQKHSISIPNLEIELGFGRGTMYRWDKSSPSIDKLQKVADYFNTSVDSLITGNTLPALSTTEERDIATDLEKMLSTLANDNEIACQGEPLDDDEKETLRISIESSLRLFKQMAKKRLNSSQK